MSPTLVPVILSGIVPSIDAMVVKDYLQDIRFDIVQNRNPTLMCHITDPTMNITDRTEAILADQTKIQNIFNC